MADRTYDYLSSLSLRLRNSSPDVWMEFVRVFDAYTTEFTVAVTEADQSQILNFQGRAQVMRSLLRLFKECDVPKVQKPVP
jgi:hypothetical protein